jgi:hypothetical protein
VSRPIGRRFIEVRAPAARFRPGDEVHGAGVLDAVTLLPCEHEPEVVVLEFEDGGEHFVSPTYVVYGFFKLAA